MKVQISTASGERELELRRGGVTLIVGPNGSGKSALLFDIYKRLGQAASYYPGHRQITFQQSWENLSYALDDLESNLSNSWHGFSRFRGSMSEEQFKGLVRKLQHSQAAYHEEMRNILLTPGITLEGIQNYLRRRDAPLDIVNDVFATAGLKPRLKMTTTGFSSVVDGHSIGLEKLFDGERAALLLTLAVVTRKTGIILIDEPEKHLHPSIAAPLLSTMMRARPNLIYVFATHDLNLMQALPVEKTLYVSRSVVVSNEPERRQYEYEELDALETIEEGLRTQILGARTNILFVEGDKASLDVAVYSKMFPNWKIAPRGGWEQVVESVKTMADQPQLHWLTTRGIIDGDGRSPGEKAALSDKGVIALQVPSIENLFFLREVLMAALVSFTNVFGGGNPNDFMRLLTSNVRHIINEDLENIVVKRAVWETTRELSALKPSEKTMRLAELSTLSVDQDAIKRRIAADLRQALYSTDGIEILEKIPLKNTGIPARLIALTPFTGIKPYKALVLTQIERQTVAGRAMLVAMKKRLPSLETALVSIE